MDGSMMACPPRANLIALSVQAAGALEALATDGLVPSKLAYRARIVLLCSRCGTIDEVARQVGASPATVLKWCRAYAAHGTAGLHDAAHAPAPGGGANAGAPVTQAPRPVASVFSLAEPVLQAPGSCRT